jgi:hypothetical protein
MFLRRHRDTLRRCPACRGRLVCPMSWGPEDDETWSIDMRCGDCEHTWSQVVANARAARFDVELDRDVAILRRRLDRLELERMATEVETFVGALRRGLIEPADFVR